MITWAVAYYDARRGDLTGFAWLAAIAADAYWMSAAFSSFAS